MANQPSAPKSAEQPAQPRRARRRPVGTANRLEFTNLDPSRNYRLVNAEPHRINMFEQAGYRIEKLEDFMPGYARLDSGLSQDNVLQVGGGQKQVLMSIEKEFYEEDQTAKQVKLDDLEKSLKPKISEGMYGDIKVSH
jgi:hypothetical protein